MTVEPILENVKTVSIYLGISEDRVYTLAREKILPSVRLGRTLKFSRQALEEFVSNGGKALPGNWKKEP